MELIWSLSSSQKKYNGELAVQCSLLHDVLEDTLITYQEIEDKFGFQVAQGVLALSKNNKIESKRDQLIDSLNRIKQQPKEIWMVKLADRITNLSPPPFYWNNEKIQSYKEDANLIYNYLYKSNTFLSERLKNRIQAYNY